MVKRVKIKFSNYSSEISKNIENTNFTFHFEYFCIRSLRMTHQIPPFLVRRIKNKKLQEKAYLTSMNLIFCLNFLNLLIVKCMWKIQNSRYHIWTHCQFNTTFWGISKHKKEATVSVCRGASMEHLQQLMFLSLVWSFGLKEHFIPQAAWESLQWAATMCQASTMQHTVKLQGILSMSDLLLE